MLQYSDMEQRGIDHGQEMLYSVGYFRMGQKPTIGFEPTTY